jgi:hypothetical protein
VDGFLQLTRENYTLGMESSILLRRIKVTLDGIIDTAILEDQYSGIKKGLRLE